jgi:WD40 repeat protein/serine/threonine protein kinase
MIRYPCSGCGQALTSPDDRAGQMAKCPRCGLLGAVPKGQATVDFVPEPTRALPGETLAPPDQAVAAVTFEAAFPGYEILGELGRGGMGVVYRARQVGLNRPVALKMILAGAHAGADQLARFKGEAEAVARLQHPNIVQIYEIGDLEGRPYFSLELVEGGSLEKHLGGKPLPPREAAQLLETLARTVHYAHQHGVIHRDLKPANVLLAPNPKQTAMTKKEDPKPQGGPVSDSATSDSGIVSDFGFRISDFVPKVTDFGLAKRLDPVSGENASRAGATRTGAVMGTPSYMAPEQASAKRHEVGPATDIYALGAILYEAVTGRPPFLAATPLETLMQVALEEPARPSQLQPRLSRDLETICLKCLQKEPRKRYASAEALADDLHRFLSGEPIVARPVGRLERLERWCRRNPVVAGLIAALILVFAVGFGAVVWKWREAEDAGAQARQAAEDARAARGKETLLRKAAQINEGTAIRSAQEAEKERKAADRERAKAEASLYFNRVALASRYWQAGNVERARELLDLCPPGHRQWEWRYLQRLFHAELLTLGPHPSKVSSVAISPDGSRIAAAGFDRRIGDRSLIQVWDRTTGAVAFSVGSNHGYVGSVACSPDGGRIAAGCQDGSVVVWSVTNDRAKQEMILEHSAIGAMPAVVFSPEEDRLVSCGSRKIKVWDLRTGQPLFSVEGPQGPADEALALACAPGGQVLASASGASTNNIKLWDLKTRMEIRTLQGHSGPVNGVDFDPSGNMLASAGSDQTVRIWRVRNGEVVHTLRGHTGKVNRVRFSHDGVRLVSAGNDGVLKVWEVASGRELFTLRGHTEAANDVVYSRDGSTIVSASNDQTVKVWEALAGGAGLLRPGQNCLAFSPDSRLLAAGEGSAFHVLEVPSGRLLFSASHANRVESVAFLGEHRGLMSADDKEIVLWDMKGKPVYRKAHPRFNVLAFGPDGKTVALADSLTGGRVRFWDARNGKEILSVRTRSRDYCLAYSPDGKRLAAAGDRAVIKVFDPATGRLALTLRGHTEAIRSLAFDGAGGRLASGSDDGTVKVWDARTGKERLALKGHRAGIKSIAFTSDGRRLVSAGEREVKIWDAETGQELLTIGQPAAQCSVSPDGHWLGLVGSDGLIRLLNTSPSPAVITIRDAGPCVALRPDGGLLVAPGFYETLKVWNTETLETVHTLTEHKDPIRRLAFHPDGKQFATASEDETAKIWDAASGKVLLTFRGHADLVNGVAFSPGGRRVASASYDGTAKVWDAATGKELCGFRAHDDRVLCVGFSPDGKTMASGGDDRNVFLWDAATGATVFKLAGHADSVNGVSFSTDGKTLASASDDRTVKIWDTKSGKLLRTLTGHTGAVRDVAFSPKGKVLACASWDQTVRLWDPDTGKELRILRGHTGGVRSLSFAADGRRLASSGEDMTVRVWDITIE